MEDDSASSYSYDQWDEDLVDLSFQSVPDLHHLLTARGHQLDYQLYRQTDILHNLLRKELDSVTGKFPESDYKSSTSTADYTSTSNPSLFEEHLSSHTSFTSTISKDPADDLFGSIITFSSFSSDENVPSSRNILSSEKFHAYSIFCILLILILLFFIILFRIIFILKNSFQKRSKDLILPLHSSYLKASISLEESYINISNCPPPCPPSFPTTATCSPSPPSPAPCPSFLPSSFSTFHPPGEDRTSPEGRSSAEAEEDEEGRDLQEGEYDERGENVPTNAEDSACNMTSIEDEKESLYAKINYKSKHQARKCGKISEITEDVNVLKFSHSSQPSNIYISECLI